ncbi:unnamed protein product [Amaranthus hypochondriacus]
MQMADNIRNSDETRINIDLINGVATSILENPTSFSSIVDLGTGSICSIYRVPEFMRKRNEEAYRPFVLSIGPFYYGDPQFKPMQEVKQIFLKLFLQHERNDHRDLNHYLDIAKNKEYKIRAYYQEDINLDSDQFIHMIVSDAVFIIYLFMVSSSQIPLNHPWIGNKLRVLLLYRSNDLILLENQLPFFILERLYNEAFGIAFPNVSFRNITLDYFGSASISGFKVAKSDIARTRIMEAKKIEHLVDFWRICFLPQQLRNKEPSNPDTDPTPNYHYTKCLHNIVAFRNHRNQQSGGRKFCRTAKELIAAGVKFIPSSDNALNVKFNNGVLEIPKITVTDYAERFFFNLQLFEQYHNFKDSYFIDFIYFLENLIDTAEDVKVLIENNMLVNMLGSEQEIANLINKAGKNIYITPKNYYYSDVTKKINAYAESRKNRWRSILKREYFKHPWAIISVIYAILLLLLTLAQTIASFTKKQ